MLGKWLNIGYVRFIANELFMYTVKPCFYFFSHWLIHHSLLLPFYYSRSLEYGGAKNFCLKLGYFSLLQISCTSWFFYHTVNVYKTFKMNSLLLLLEIVLNSCQKTYTKMFLLFHSRCWRKKFDKRENKQAIHW